MVNGSSKICRPPAWEAFLLLILLRPSGGDVQGIRLVAVVVHRAGALLGELLYVHTARFGKLHALAELLAARKPRESHPELVYPLRGILVCPLCGLLMKLTYARTRGQIHRYYECPNHINRDKGCPTHNLPAEAIEMAVASNLASLASNPAMMRVLQVRLPQLAHRDISEALAKVEQLVEYIPDDALATLFQALYKEVSYNAAAQELNIVKYSA